MSAERVIANTLRLAQADLDAARLLHAGKNRYAIYHCEQAAEKIIKAVLTSEGVHANIKHQLDDMVKQVPDANPLKPLLKQIEHLAAYATTYRYATTSGNIKPSPDDATRCCIAWWTGPRRNCGGYDNELRWESAFGENGRL